MAEPVTPRQTIAAEIAAAYPGAYVVNEYPKAPEQVHPGKPYIDVYETNREFVRENPAEAQLRITVSVELYSGKTDLAAAEDQVEDTRDDVLAVLEAAEWLHVQQAERVQFLEQYPGCRVTVQVFGPNVYRPDYTP